MSEVVNKGKKKHKNLEIDKTDPLTKKEEIEGRGGSGKRSIVYKIEKILQTLKIKIMG